MASSRKAKPSGSLDSGSASTRRPTPPPPSRHRGAYPSRMGRFTSFLPLLFLLAFFTQAVHGASSTTGSAVGQKHSSSSVFSLFNLKAKSKFWSEKIMHNVFEDLERPEHGSTKAALQNFTNAGSIADYLKFEPVEAIYLPIPVNFIFVGFEGKGNHEFKLGREELERWFTQIDHIFEHTRVPQLGEALTPFYKQRADDEYRHHLPFVSCAHYNFSVHAVEMGESVTAVFERALHVLARKDDFNDSRPDSEVLWQVDIDDMSYIFTSLIHYLQVENAYNIFVMNLKRTSTRIHYGYRRGLSQAEIDLLKQDTDIQTNLLRMKKDQAYNPLDMEKLRRPLYTKHPMISFSWTTVETSNTAHWVDTTVNALNIIEQSLQGKTPSEIVVEKSRQIMHGKSYDLASTLQRIIKREENYGLQEECLVDTWIGKERWAFIDLTAGPFTWGPAVGGDGVRTEHNLPSVDKMFSLITDNSSVMSEEDAQQELHDLVEDRFSFFDEEDSSAIDTLLAEIDIYEVFFQKHCRGRHVKLAICEELRERMDDLKEELQVFENEDYDETFKKKAEDALQRIERWNLFSDVQEPLHVFNYSVARDWFLAHLGATLSSAMKHVITPSTADGAFHFYEKINFQIFFITQENVKHVNLLPVDVSAVKEALSSLVVAQQKYQFGIKMLPLSGDSALSMAFSVARRAATLPILLVNGTYRTATRVYIDSLILQHQLQHLSESQSIYGLGSHGRSVLEVPIFWFIRQGEPLLIDKHYVAKALPDMVLVVQSSEPSWESHLQCNGQSILWDLSNPLKDAVAATAEHLAGLIPAYVTYSEAHETAIQDWTWSVGCHPFSSTSSGSQLSLFQTDAIARSYIVTYLDESVDLINGVIELLVKERTYKETFSVFRKHEHLLLNNYNSIISSWKRIAGYMEDLQYGEALRLLNYIEDVSVRLMRTANATVYDLHPVSCTRQRKLEVGYAFFTGLGIGVLLVFLLLILRPRRSKPKIN